jgi:hypothetical protein
VTTIADAPADWPDIEGLLAEYDRWLTLPGLERDEYSAFKKLAALYRFALTHMDAPGNELLFEALAAVDQTWNE